MLRMTWEMHGWPWNSTGYLETFIKKHTSHCNAEHHHPKVWAVSDMTRFFHCEKLVAETTTAEMKTRWPQLGGGGLSQYFVKQHHIHKSEGDKEKLGQIQRENLVMLQKVPMKTWHSSVTFLEGKNRKGRLKQAEFTESESWSDTKGNESKLVWVSQTCWLHG